MHGCSSRAGEPAYTRHSHPLHLQQTEKLLATIGHKIHRHSRIHDEPSRPTHHGSVQRPTRPNKRSRAPPLTCGGTGTEIRGTSSLLFPFFKHEYRYCMQLGIYTFSCNARVCVWIQSHLPNSGVGMQSPQTLRNVLTVRQHGFLRLGPAWLRP